MLEKTAALKLYLRFYSCFSFRPINSVVLKVFSKIYTVWKGKKEVSVGQNVKHRCNITLWPKVSIHSFLKFAHNIVQGQVSSFYTAIQLFWANSGVM